MKPAELLTFLRTHPYAVQSSVSQNGTVQSAVVGVAFTDQFEIIFDSIDSTRKVVNLKAHPKIAFVVGGSQPGDERTVQYQGIADFPSGDELERVKKVYFAAFPDGPTRLSWPGITYVRAKPSWVRFSDLGAAPPKVIELKFPLS
jgi:hypothetical protein